jgi:putative transposase
MKLTAQVKLLPNEEQALALRQTLEQANVACNYLSERAWESKVFRQFALHRLAYYDTRDKFPDLSAQIVIRCTAKVADAYKLDKKVKRTFTPLGAIAYDLHILRWYVSQSFVSIWTIAGRQRIPFVCGEKQRQLLARQQGESDLVLRRGKWYLFTVCAVDDPDLLETDGVLGVDLGIVNIAADSDGIVYSGSKVNALRARHSRLRAKLQSKGTKSARRLLKKRSHKEQRFAKDTNHVISKRLVEKAKDTHRLIALEDLTGIRERVTVRKANRRQHASWSFFDLRQKIEYKARRVGVPVIMVDPRNTSRTCRVCGTIDKHSRPSQSVFHCVHCGFSDLADHNAACVIAGRAIINRPNVSALTG